MAHEDNVKSLFLHQWEKFGEDFKELTEKYLKLLRFVKAVELSRSITLYNFDEEARKLLKEIGEL